MKILKSIIRILSGVMLFGIACLFLLAGYDCVLQAIDIWQREPMAYLYASAMLAGLASTIVLGKRVIPWAFKKD